MVLQWLLSILQAEKQKAGQGKKRSGVCEGRGNGRFASSPNAVAVVNNNNRSVICCCCRYSLCFFFYDVDHKKQPYVTVSLSYIINFLQIIFVDVSVINNCCIPVVIAKRNGKHGQL